MKPSDVLETWFGTDDAAIAAMAPRWFRRDPALDEELRVRFEPSIGRAAAGGLLHWEDTPDGALALVILLDQFSRNVYRESARSFAQDAAALGVARRALARGFEHGFVPPKRGFFLMPFMHAEDGPTQVESLARHEALAVVARGGPWEKMASSAYDYAVQHADIIRRFGRFPHRNEVLGRDSTAAELGF